MSRPRHCSTSPGETLELYPGYRPALQMLALSCPMAGDGGRAVVHRERSRGERRRTMEPLRRRARLYLRPRGRSRGARAVLARWNPRAERECVLKTSLALLELGLGNDVEAARWIEQARRERDPWLVLMTQDPAFGACLRGSVLLPFHGYARVTARPRGRRFLSPPPGAPRPTTRTGARG